MNKGVCRYREPRGGEVVLGTPVASIEVSAFRITIATGSKLDTIESLP